MTIEQKTTEDLPQSTDDEFVVSSTGLPTISEAPCEPTVANQHSLTPDEDTGDGWVATDIEP